jgi:pimeloyl-ACP methyl ester carboxylesterase
MRRARSELLSFIASSLACLTLALPAAAEQVKLPDGAELHVREAGSGPRTMVLIHGWSMSSDVWTKVLAAPPAGFRLLAYDIRGFGDSSKPPEGYDYKALVEDLHQLLDAKGIERAVLAGHSLGSFFVQDFAAAHPNRVEALVLTSPQPRTTQLSISPPIQKLIEDVGPDKDRRSFFTTNTPRYFASGTLSAGDLDAFITVNMKAAPQALQGTMQTAFTAAPLPPESFRSGQIPALVIVGSHDIVPLSVVQRITSDMPGSCAAVIARAGHSSPWEKPEAWLQEVTSYLGQQGRVRRCP